MTQQRPRDARAFAAFDRALVVLAAFICVAFLSTLRDTAPLRWVAPAAAMLTPAARGNASSEVRVTDAEGRPFEGAVVRVFHVDVAGQVYFAGEARSTGTPDGAVFEGLPPGEAWIVAYGKARARASTRVFLGEPRRLVTLALRDGASLSARVTDEGGNPVPFATVSVRTTDPLPHVVISDESGSVAFDRLGPPPWAVEVTADGFDTIARSGVYPEATPLELRLEHLGGFEVLVVDEAGEPEPFAEVLVSGPGIWPARSALTDAAGELLITGLYEGVYDLKARLGDRVSRTDLSVPLPRGKLVERTLTLTTGRYVTVRVTDGPGPGDGIDPDPIEGADVVLVEEGLSAFPVEARTGKTGVAILGPVTEGVATVSARADGFVPRMIGGDDALALDEVSIPLLRGGVIFGDVRDDRGFPVDGATIEVLGTDIDGMPIHETTDRSTFRDDLFAFSLGGPVPLIPKGELGVVPGPVPPIPRAGDPFAAGPSRGGEPWVSRADGTYRAAPVTPGHVQVLVKHPEYIETMSDVVKLVPGGEVEVRIVLGRGGRLEGRVLEDDRTPVAAARVEIAALEGTFGAITYSADDGTFTVASVPRSILVSVSRPDTPSEIATRLVIEVPPGERAEIEIILPKAREPTALRVVDDRGYPLDRVEARVVSLDLETALARTFFTGDDGLVEVPGARGLPLRVVLERPGQASLVALIDSAAAEHQLVMARSRTLHGSVTAREGRDRIEGAEITLYTESGARHATTDLNGDFEITDLAEGRVRAIARHEGHAEAERVLWFEGDPSRPIVIDTIDLVLAGTVEGTVVDDRGDPVAGARVGYLAVPTYLPVGKLPHGIALTDAQGRFRLDGVPEGEASLEAYSPELGRGNADVFDIRAGRTTDRVVITIPDQDYDPRKLRGAGSVALTLVERQDAVVVHDVPEGGEAELSGVEPDDVLVTIAGRAVRSLEQARDALGGPLGEDVVLELSRGLPKGGPLRVRLRVRREVVRR